MAYKTEHDGTTAADSSRVRGILARRADVVERRMFGGLCFTANGAMCCGLVVITLVQVGPDQHEGERQYARAANGLYGHADEGLRLRRSARNQHRSRVDKVGSTDRSPICLRLPKRKVAKSAITGPKETSTTVRFGRARLA